MAERREFDFFNYIFNRDGETDEPPTDTKEQQLPLMNLTEKSDEDDVSNSTAAALKQRNRPRRAQPDQLQGLKIDQCSISAERREFDLFAYIFNRDGEEDQPQEEDSPLVDSDEAGASNSTLAVFQPQQPQSSRLLL